MITVTHLLAATPDISSMSHVSSTESEVLLAAAPFLINIGLLVVGFGVLKYLAKQEQSHWQSKAKVINTKGGIVPSDYDDGIMYRRLEHTIHTFEAVTIGLIPVLALVLIPSVSGNVSVILWTAIGMFIFGLRYFLYMLTIEVTIDDSLPWRKRVKTNATFVGCIVNLIALGIAVGITASA